MSATPRHKWVLLTHQLPSRPSGLRVKVWRRLQAVGAVAVRQSVYVLPATPSSLEDFQWLRQEISAAGGEATVFTAAVTDAVEDQRIVDAFRAARDQDYAAVLRDLEALAHTAVGGDESDPAAELGRLRQRLETALAVDFFAAPRQAEAVAALQRCEALLRAAPAQADTITPCDPARYRGRRWVTRKGLHIDRLASAWLIRRHIDPEARFAFVDEGVPGRRDDVPFDMFGAEFGHRCEGCTFEALMAAFGLEAQGLSAIARIVHDGDLKDGRFARVDSPGIEKAVRALGAGLSDRRLLEVGMALFDGLLEIVSQEGGT